MLDQADSNMMLDSMPGMASVHSNNVGDLPGRMKMGIAWFNSAVHADDCLLGSSCGETALAVEEMVNYGCVMTGKSLAAGLMSHQFSSSAVGMMRMAYRQWTSPARAECGVSWATSPQTW